MCWWSGFLLTAMAGVHQSTAMNTPVHQYTVLLYLILCNLITITFVNHCIQQVIGPSLRPLHCAPLFCRVVLPTRFSLSLRAPRSRSVHATSLTRSPIASFPSDKLFACRQVKAIRPSINWNFLRKILMITLRHSCLKSATTTTPIRFFPALCTILS